MNILMLIRPKTEVAYLFDNQTIKQGLDTMKSHGYSAIPVICEDGSYYGTVSEGDFLWHILEKDDTLDKKKENIKIHDIIRKDRNAVVNVTAPMDELLLRVMDQNFVPVIDDRNLFMGIVTRRDVLAYYYKREEKWQKG